MPEEGSKTTSPAGSKAGSKTTSPGGSKAGSKTGTPAAAGTPAAPGSAAPGSATPGTPRGEEVVEDIPAPPEEEKRPVRYYRHWVRPKFLQYKYMYNYRTNYYDDVIDYLDKKARGINRALPQPQTWAERVLRTNAASGRVLDDTPYQHKDEHHLIQVIAASIKTHNYHTKAYINQRYARVL